MTGLFVDLSDVGVFGLIADIGGRRGVEGGDWLGRGGKRVCGCKAVALLA